MQFTAKATSQTEAPKKADIQCNSRKVIRCGL